MTPFQKKFPNATKDTVFEVIYAEGLHLFRYGDLVCLEMDDETKMPYFKSRKIEHGISGFIHLRRLKIHNPINQGDLVDGKDEDGGWKNTPYIYLADKEEFLKKYVGRRHVFMRKCDGMIGGTDEVRPHNPNQELTLEDGTVLSIPTKKIEKLKARYAK